ncbi:MAG: SusC/RagA family TonB-linked outer membrane protein [Prevotella sp.]|jgi:TonB-linked SusC/RagA family outer membrane protein|nr:SusC/RagA family TonB-linked outer membrane protein [Prevotella sp.]
MKIKSIEKNRILFKLSLKSIQQTKIISFILFIAISGLFSQKTYSQLARININARNINLKDVMSQIEKQTNYLFVYNPNEVNLDRKTSLSLKAKSVNNVLAAVFNKTDISYHIEGNNIMLMKRLADAQPDKKKITGIVVDEYGEPLAGATVGIKGSTEGAITGMDGKFELNAVSGSTLVVSFMGYISATIVVSDQDNYDVKLTPDSQELDAVVVTALGIKRSQKALSYNAQEVSQDELTRIKDANFINALSGKVAGVTINSSSSGVGGASKVVMRGVKSIDQSNNAMYVIDGIPMFNTADKGSMEKGSSGATEAIADINPEDIESLTVLNGAAASALYGSNAANGVILVTTKTGKAGKTSLAFTQNTEFLSPFVLPKFQNSYGTGSLGVNTTDTDLSWGSKLNASNSYGYDPRNDYFGTGVVTTESLTLSTGNERNQTYASVGAVNSEGIIHNNTYDRLNFSIRNTTSLLNDKMKLDLGASYIKQKDNNMTNQGEYQNPLVPVYLFPRGGDWNDVRMYEEWNTSRRINTQRWKYGLTTYTGQNPYWINYRNLRSNTKDRYMMNAGLSYNVLDWLNLSGRVRTDFSETKYTERLYASTNTTLTEGSSTGYYGQRSIRDRQTYADVLANINKTFAEDIALTANAGASVSDIMQDYQQVRGPLMDGTYEGAVPNVFNVMQIDRTKLKPYQDKYQDQTQSVFASVETGYKGAYYLTLTGRFDWPSQLAGDQSSKSGFFYPSVGASFILSEILPAPKQIDYLKLRASFASVGLPFERRLAQKYHSWDEGILGYNPNYDHFPIAFLDPQKTDSWELGITARVLKNFKFDIGLYHAKTYNQVFNANLSSSSGYVAYYVQSGSVTNKGIELSLGYGNAWNDFRWSTNYTLSANSNRINRLANNWVNPASGELYPVETLTLLAFGDTRFILKEGGTLGDLYSLSDLQRDSNGYIYVDAAGNISKISVADNPVKLGSVLPKANMSWRNDLSWKNFNLGFMLSARLGGVVYSATQAILDSQGVSETSETARDKGGVMINGNNLIDAQTWYSKIGTSSNVAQYYTYSATNVRLQEVSLGHTFPKSKLWGIGDVTVSLVGRNLLMLYNKAPFDPEAVATTGNNYQGVDYFMMPSTRSMGFNVKVRF